MPYKISGPNNTVIGMRDFPGYPQKPVLMPEGSPPVLFDTEDGAAGARQALRAMPRLAALELKVEAAE